MVVWCNPPDGDDNDEFGFTVVDDVDNLLAVGRDFDSDETVFKLMSNRIK